MPIPILIISDAPTAGSGLGRITRDLATRIAQCLPEFRVATLGYGGTSTRTLPFHQYDATMQDWVIFNLPDVWKDHAGDEEGIILTIWDATRLLWFSRPENCPDPRLKKFLEEGKFQRWGYFPMDANGISGKLRLYLKHIVEGYDRVLAYSKWAENILRCTLDDKDLLAGLTNLPHGIDRSVFYPRPKVQARHSFGHRLGARNQKGNPIGIPDDATMIGIVATNQVRKDYGLGLSVVSRLKRQGEKLSLWIHTDELERHWCIPALLDDLDLMKEAIVTVVPYTDEIMAWAYSACDVTLGIGLGEGFGYPIFESLACGTPCIHGDDGGAPEHMPSGMLVKPVGTRIEGIYNCIRSVYDPDDWVRAVNWQFPQHFSFPAHLDWNNLWPQWEDWFKAGIL